MRLVSGDGSYAKGEWSALAVVETLIAVATASWMAFLTGSLSSVAWWSLVGWLFMLRTNASSRDVCVLFCLFFSMITRLRGVPCLLVPKSVRARLATPWSAVGGYVISVPYSGLRLDLRLWQAVERIWSIVLNLIFIVLLLSGSLIIKLAVGGYHLFRHPVDSVLAIPQNWARAAGALDLFTPLEFVPGWTEFALLRHDSEPKRPWAFLEGPRLDDARWDTLRVETTLGEAVSLGVLVLLEVVVGWLVWSYYGPLSSFFKLQLDLWLPLKFAALLLSGLVAVGFIEATTVLLVGSPLRIVLYLPALCYRLALKATSITYFPLLWVVRQSTKSDELSEQLESIRDGKYSGARRVLSWVFLSLVTAKILWWSILVRLKEAAGDRVTAFFVDVYIAPTIQLWQIAGVANACLNIAFYYFFADPWLQSMKHGRRIDEPLAWGCLRIYLWTTGLLSLYCTAVNVWIIAHHEPFLQLPPVGTHWWPDVR